MSETKTFRTDVKVTGFTEIVCKAATLEEAEEKAMDQALQLNVKDLRWKTMDCDNLTEG